MSRSFSLVTEHVRLTVRFVVFLLGWLRDEWTERSIRQRPVRASAWFEGAQYTVVTLPEDQGLCLEKSADGARTRIPLPTDGRGRRRTSNGPVAIAEHRGRLFLVRSEGEERRLVYETFDGRAFSEPQDVGQGAGRDPVCGREVALASHAGRLVLAFRASGTDVVEVRTYDGVAFGRGPRSRFARAFAIARPPIGQA